MTEMPAILADTARHPLAGSRAAALQRRGSAAFERSHCVAGYQIEAVLGRGRHSVVYLALQPRGNRKVALKVAQRAHPGTIGGAKDLGGEFTALAALCHPHVIKVFDHGVSGDAAFLAMEYATDGPVARRCGPLGQIRTVSLLSQAADALGWIHRQGWVHRDVKPANLLLRTDGTLALGDFGCARRRSDAGTLQEGVVVGTPRYAAPEQSQGAPADPAEDVYSLGACLYEMLCAQSLYPGETLTELLGQHQLAPVPRLSRDLAAWQPLLDAMLAKDPRQRLPDGQAVLRQLQGIQYLLHRGPEQDTGDPS